MASERVRWWDRVWRLWVPLAVIMALAAILIVTMTIYQSLHATRVTDCARRLAAEFNKTTDEWIDGASDVLAGQFASRDDIKKRFDVIGTHRERAVKMQTDFANDPALPCPLDIVAPPGSTSVSGTGGSTP